MAKTTTVPQTYKGKKVNDMSIKEYQKMLNELGLNDPKVKPKEGPIEDDMSAPLKRAKGGNVSKFKPCPGCPTPAKCKAAGKCLMKEKAKMTSKGSKKAATGMLVIPVKMTKTPAKKGKKG